MTKIRQLAMLAALLGALGGPVLAQSSPQGTSTAGPSIAALFAKTDSGSGTTLDRMVGAIAAQQAAQTAHSKAMGERVAADTALAPVAKRLDALRKELERLPADTPSDMNVRASRSLYRDALTREVTELSGRAGPLEAAFQQKGEAEMAAKATLEEADKWLAESKLVWQQAMMEPAMREVTTLAIELAKVTAERDAAVTAKADLDALRAKVADFCRRNTNATSLCPLDKTAQATGG